MSARTKSTVKMLCVRSAVMHEQIPIEAQKILDLHNDPDVAPEQKAIAKQELDQAIRNLEDKVATTRRVKGEFGPEKP
jgi:hypothetical protein